MMGIGRRLAAPARGWRQRWHLSRLVWLGIALGSLIAVQGNAEGDALDDFTAANNGKVVGDGQCVALAQAWERYNGWQVMSGTGTACTEAGQKWSDYTWIQNTPTGVPLRGDLVIWYCSLSGSGGAGHIAVFISGDTNSFQSFDQNWPVGSAAHVQTHSYTSVYGWQHHNGCGPAPSVNWGGLAPNRWYGPTDVNSQISWCLQDQGGGTGGFCGDWGPITMPPSPCVPDQGCGYVELSYLAADQREGQHTVYVRGWNAARCAYSDSSQGWFGYDASPPNVIWTAYPQAGLWYNTEQQVAWHVEDDLSGVYGWDHSWTGDPGCMARPMSDGSQYLSVAGEGWHTAYVRACDNVGNSALYTIGPFGYDATPPTVDSLTCDPPSPGTADTVTITCSASDALSGVKEIDISVDGTPVGSIPGTSGSVTWDATPATDGSHTIAAVAVDNATNTSAASTVTYVLYRAAPVSVAVPDVSGCIGQTVTLQATLSLSGGGAAVSGEPLRFSVDGADAGTATTGSDGAASVTYTIPASIGVGAHTITVQHDATATYGAASGTGTLTVTKRNVFFSLKPVSGAPGQTVTLKTLVYSGDAPVSGLTIQFAVDGVPAGTATSGAINAALSYTIPASMPSGLHNVTVSFAGTIGYNAATRTAAALSVRTNVAFSLRAASGSPGQTVTLKTLVYSGGAPVSGLAIQFAVDGVPAGTATSGAINAALSYTIPASMPSGLHNVTVSFAGNDDYYAATRTAAALTVRTNVAFSLRAASGSPGQTVTLRTLVYSGGAPVSGLPIQFAVDAVPVGTATSGASGASLSVTIPQSAVSGLHNVTVSFAGNASYCAATRTAAALTVNQPKAGVAFSLRAASGAPGQTVTLRTLVYSAGAPVSGLPIQFAVDGVPAGSGVSDSTGAACSYRIPVGMIGGLHNVTVSFAGSTSYYAATRTAAALTVK